MRRNLQRNSLFAALSFCLLSANIALAAADCTTYPTFDQDGGMSREQDKFKYYTENSHGSAVIPGSLNTKAVSGIGGVIFPPTGSNGQGTSTKIKERPRNLNCTLAPFVYDENKKSISFHDDPKCDSNQHGYWEYTVPKVDKVRNSKVTSEGVTYDQTFSIGWRGLGTLKHYDVFVLYNVYEGALAGCQGSQGPAQCPTGGRTATLPTGVKYNIPYDSGTHVVITKICTK